MPCVPPADAALAVLDRVTRALPAGETRPGQRAMCAAIAAGIAEGRPGVFRAPTGSGKSAAYLAAAVASGERVIVATASIALQDQLAAKDLPHVAAHAGVPVSWAVLKGRANYVCLARLAERARALDAGRLDLDGPVAVRHELTRIAAWAAATTTGDRAELPEEPSPEAWRQVSVGGDECPGAQVCPHAAGCFAERAVAASRQARIVVVSTHLYALHVAMGGVLLPEHRVVVVDEAHELEEICSSVLGSTVTPGRLRWLASSARATAAAEPAAQDALGRAATVLAEALAPLDGQRLDPAGLPGPLAAALDAAGRAVDTVVAQARQAAQHARDRQADEAHAAAQRVVKAGASLLDDLRRPTVGVGADTVVFVEQGSLRVAPLDLAGTLRTTLWDNGIVGILTSATIDDGLPRRVGLAGTPVVDVASTFDHRANGLLYVPALPDPRSPGWEAAAHDELAALLAAAGGRTLALFTSWARTRAAAAALRERVTTPILVQGEQPRAQLLARFVADEAASLFATTSFWQGVDAPGRTCVLVVVDRLPFPRPDEPLTQALRERAGEAAFTEVDLPRAATLLAQGVGRLLRTGTDRGVVAVLDRRLAEASYRRVILDALPPLRRTRARADALAFLAEVVGPA